MFGCGGREGECCHGVVVVDTTPVVTRLLSSWYTPVTTLLSSWYTPLTATIYIPSSELAVSMEPSGSNEEIEDCHRAQPVFRVRHHIFLSLQLGDGLCGLYL